MMPIEMLRSLLSRNVVDEAREPILSFPIRGVGALGLLAPHPIFWLQVSPVLMLQAAITAATAVAIYYLIVQKLGSHVLLIGYGIFFPLMILIPFQIANFLRIHNMAMLLGLAGSMSIVLFRCMMAIHDTLPGNIGRGLRPFVFFFVSPIQFNFDENGEVISSSKKEMCRKVLKTIYSMVLLSLSLGLMHHYDYELFPRKEISSFVDLFYWSNICNNYAMAYLTGRGLECSTMMVGTAIELFSGNSVIELSDNPLTASTSVSDFWSKRWNILMHSVLKYAVYIPLRKNGFSSAVSAIFTFGASGVLHEYILTILAFRSVLFEDHTAYVPKYGYHLAFFAWNGIVLILENFLYKHAVVRWIKKTLPRPVITMMVIMTVLPIAHWFTDEYVEIGFFDDLAVGMPQFVWIPEKKE